MICQEAVLTTIDSSSGKKYKIINGLVSRGILG